MSVDIVFIVYPGIKLLDLAGPLQVFSDALNRQGIAAYKVTIASANGGKLATDTTLSVSSVALSQWRKRKIDTLIIVGGDGVYETLTDKMFIADARFAPAHLSLPNVVCLTSAKR